MITKTLQKIGHNHFIVYPAQNMFVLKNVTAYSYSHILRQIREYCRKATEMWGNF